MLLDLIEEEPAAASATCISCRSDNKASRLQLRTLIHLPEEDEQLVAVIMDHVHLVARLSAIDVQVLQLVEHRTAYQLECKAARTVDTTINGQAPKAH